MEKLLEKINFKVRLGRRTGQLRALEYCFKSAKRALTEVTFWDNEIAGFGMRVYRSGKRSYFIQYRERRDNRKKIIGDADTMDPRMARRKARELLGKVKLGLGVVCTWHLFDLGDRDGHNGFDSILTFVHVHAFFLRCAGVGRLAHGLLD
jgi:hypothetical protein